MKIADMAIVIIMLMMRTEMLFLFFMGVFAAMAFGNMTKGMKRLVGGCE